MYRNDMQTADGNSTGAQGHTVQMLQVRSRHGLNGSSPAT